MNVERNNVCPSWCLIEESYVTIKFTDANHDICPISEYKVLSQRNRPFSLLYRVSLSWLYVSITVIFWEVVPCINSIPFIRFSLKTRI